MPSIIKKVLRKRSSSSSPGDDGITYHHLKMMPLTHHFLATLFSKVLLCSHVPPILWTHAEIILIHKKGDTTDPANFRPNAVTSAIGELFHKILANRPECYLILNKMIDESLQNGFLSGVNGCTEHVFACYIVDDCQCNGPLPPTFSEFYRFKECIWIYISYLHQ